MDIIDKYSIIHFIAGFIVYFLRINITSWFILNTVFEMYENMGVGSSVTNIVMEKFSISSGNPETLANSIGDVICSLVGWICAYYLDKKIIHLHRNNVHK